MGTTIYRTEDPALETIEFGAVYQTHSPRTGEPWPLYKIADGWDDAYEYAMADEDIWSRLTHLAMDAYLAHAILEVAIAPVNDEETCADSRALLHRFSWPY